MDVIIVTHNGRRYVGRCLQSLAQGGTPLSVVVVVDNASTDGTAEFIRGAFPDVRVIESPKNAGYGAGANVGLTASQSEYVAVLNQDVVVHPGWLDTLVEALDADPRLGLATPTIVLRSDPSRINAAGNEVHYSGITTCLGYGRPRTDARTAPVAAVSGAALVVRRSVLDRLDGFDPLFFMYLEDADLSLRAALAGSPAITCADAVVEHDFAPRFAADKIFWLEGHRALLLLRLFRFRTLVALAPGLALVEVLVLGYAATRGPAVLAAKLRSYGWVARSFRAILASRGRVQAIRRVGDRALLDSMALRLSVDELEGRGAHVAAAVANPLLAAWGSLARRVVRW